MARVNSILSATFKERMGNSFKAPTRVFSVPGAEIPNGSPQGQKSGFLNVLYFSGNQSTKACNSVQCLPLVSHPFFYNCRRNRLLIIEMGAMSCYFGERDGIWLVPTPWFSAVCDNAQSDSTVLRLRATWYSLVHILYAHHCYHLHNWALWGNPSVCTR